MDLLLFVSASSSVTQLGNDGLAIKRSQVRVSAGAAGEFSSPWSIFCADTYFGIRSTPVLPQQHGKDPGHSVKSAGGS